MRQHSYTEDVKSIINGHPVRILVVDDDAMLRTLMRVKLSRNGYDVTEAADGTQAITAFNESHPDIILMDANMPGTDGFQATETIKKNSAAENSTIIMVSSLEDDESVDRAFSLGATEYITKPICWPLLLHRLANICAAMRAKQHIIQAKHDADHANLSKSEFLANMSHELRTPMHAILSFSYMGVSKSESAERDKLMHYFVRIEQSGKRLLTLLNNLLDLSKMEAGRMDLDIRQEDILGIINAVVAEMDALIRQRQLQVHIIPPVLATIVPCDMDKMFQVITNLLSNAVKFTPEGTAITISIDAGQLFIGDSEATIDTIKVTVSDQGIGIPEAELKDVFDKFVQSSKTKTGAGGTGLGLAITKEIVEQHGGAIHAEANTEGGASFIFHLPVQSNR
jgi:signal transduction histidine kinase